MMIRLTCPSSTISIRRLTLRSHFCRVLVVRPMSVPNSLGEYVFFIHTLYYVSICLLKLFQAPHLFNTIFVFTYQGQTHGNGRPISVMPLHLYLPSMILNQPTRDCQAQADAMRLCGKKRLENALDLVGRNASAGVADADL